MVVWIPDRGGMIDQFAGRLDGWKERATAARAQDVRGQMHWTAPRPAQGGERRYGAEAEAAALRLHNRRLASVIRRLGGDRRS